MAQVTAVPTQEWNRIVRILERLDKQKHPLQKTEWLTLSQFRRRQPEVTSSQWRYMRNVTNPDWYRVKPGSTQYQINYTAYYKAYGSESIEKSIPQITPLQFHQSATISKENLRELANLVVEALLAKRPTI